jgi:hypothetical protein
MLFFVSFKLAYLRETLLQMKIIILSASLLISLIINYVLFIPSSAVNLMFSVFVNDKNRAIMLFDLSLSNLIFFWVFTALTTFSQRLNIDRK